MLIGHEKNKKYFQNIIKSNALNHAYLFTGPEMIGKRTFAIELAEIINGRKITNDPDFKLISPKIADGKSKIYIDDSRTLKSFLSLKSYQGPYKIVIIDDAHCLTVEAANALLKVLEEPLPFSILILVTSIPGMLLPTILSRCEEIKFMPVGKELSAQFISQNKKLSQEDKTFLLTLADGRIGLLEKLTEDNNLASAKKYIDDLRKLLNSPIYERMEYAKKIYDKEIYNQAVDYWLYWVSAHLKNSPKNATIIKDLISLSGIISQPQFNHRLALENFLINL